MDCFWWKSRTEVTEYNFKNIIEGKNHIVQDFVEEILTSYVPYLKYVFVPSTDVEHSFFKWKMLFSDNGWKFAFEY